MLPFLVDKSWFENYWYGDGLRRKRRPLAMSLARFAVCAVLALGGAFAVGKLHSTGTIRIMHGHSMME